MVIFCKNWSLSAMNIVILNYFFIMTIMYVFSDVLQTSKIENYAQGE